MFPHNWLTAGRRIVFVVALAEAAFLCAPSARASVVAVRSGETIADINERLEVVESPGVPHRMATWSPPPTIGREPRRRVFWGRLTLEPQLQRHEAYVLIAAPFWERVELYEEAGGRLRRLAKSGSALNLDERTVRHSELLLPVTLDPHTPQQLYIRFETYFDRFAQPSTFLRSMEPQLAFLERDLQSRHAHGIYVGIMLAIVLYNLFLYFSVRDRTYLLYVLYASAFGAIWTYRSGVFFELLWPDAPRWNDVSSFVFMCAAIILGNRFVQAFLGMRERAPWLNHVLNATTVVVMLVAVGGLLGAWRIIEQPLAVCALVASITYFVAGVRVARGGFAPARIFVIACSALIAGVIAYVFTYFGILPRTPLSVYGVQIGSALEMILLAFALGSRIRVLEEDKRAAEIDYRRRLEREVGERTAELTAVAQQLDEMTRIDSLTGIANRREFDLAFDTEWRRAVRAREPLAVIIIDVDHFKAFNDRYGHLAGDECLRRVANALSEGSRRAGDVLARYGGEEFAVILARTTRTQAIARAEILRLSVESLRIANDASPVAPVITVSAGVAVAANVENTTAEELLAQADAALYAAKRQGRNRVVAGGEIAGEAIA